MLSKNHTSFKTEFKYKVYMVGLEKLPHQSDIYWKINSVRAVEIKILCNRERIFFYD